MQPETWTGDRGGSVDQALIELGQGNDGVCSSVELSAHGVSAASASRRVRSGLLSRPHRGVYVVEALRNTDTSLRAALLACPEAIASRQSAARLHRFAAYRNGIHLTAPKGAGRKLAGVVVHEARRLEPADITHLRGMATTTSARTLVDLASVAPSRSLKELVDRQVAVEQPTSTELLACFAAQARRGFPGVVKLRQVLAGLDEHADPYPESELERRLDLLSSRAGMSLRRQYRPPWYDGRRGIVDFADPPSRTIIEADGLKWHSSQRAMADDRARDRIAARHGWLVVRVTWHEVVERPDELATELRSIIESRRISSIAA